MKTVIVASTNPVKINAAKRGFSSMFPDEAFSFKGIRVPSGVSDQPMSQNEMLKGARNRVENAKKQAPDADFWIGIEGGVEDTGKDMEVFAGVIIESKSGTVGKGRTGTFIIPSKVARLIRKGKELGEADDIVFGMKDSKMKIGSVGILTNKRIDRTSYYADAVILALIPFKNPNLYS